MTEAQMLQWLGEPTTTRGQFYSYGSHDDFLGVGFRDGRAYTISTNQSRYQTAEGIGVGTSALKLRATHGSPSRTKDWSEVGELQLCFDNGLDVTLDTATSRVKLVTVYYRGCSAP